MQNKIIFHSTRKNLRNFFFFLLDKKEFRSRRVEGTRDELILACQPWTIAHPYSSLIAGVKEGNRQPTFTTFLRVSSRTPFISFSRLPRALSSTHEGRIVLRWCVTGIINNRWRGIMIVLPSTAVRVTRVALMSYLYHWHVHSRARVLLFNGFIDCNMMCD